MEKREDRARLARDRVRAKIRYAQLMLAKLREHNARGDDFDIAHEEACLAHLDGAVDALIQEINICHELELQVVEVRRRSLHERLATKAINCPEFAEVTKLLDDGGSWLSQMREYRNHQMHRGVVNRDYLFQIGPDVNVKKIRLRDPQTGNLEERDRFELFESWIQASDTLFERLGASLRSSCGLPPYLKM